MVDSFLKIFLRFPWGLGREGPSLAFPLHFHENPASRIPHPASRILHVFVRSTLNLSGGKAVTHTILFPLKTTHLNLLVVKVEQQ